MWNGRISKPDLTWNREKLLCLKMLKLQPLFLFAVCALVLRKSDALTEEEHKEMAKEMMPIIKECSQEHGANPEDIIAAKKNKDIDGIDSCLIECVMKKKGVVNDDGMFEPEKFIETMKKIIKNDEDTAKLEEVAKTCTAVNENTSYDKCGRSKALFACIMEQKKVLEI